MSWLLDTCALSERLNRLPNRGFVRWMDAADPHDLFISVLSLGELRMGVDLLPRSAKRRKLETWLNEHLIPFFQDRTLSFDREVALAWGRLFAECQLEGRKPPVIDSQLAATARLNGLTLVTRNSNDFLFLKVEVLNPWS